VRQIALEKTWGKAIRPRRQCQWESAIEQSAPALAKYCQEWQLKKSIKIVVFFLVVFVRLDTNTAMKKPSSFKKVTGLAGAAALAGATQAYGTPTPFTLPPDFIPSSNTTSPSHKIFVDVDGNGTNDLEFGFFQSPSAPNEFFTGIYVLDGTAVAYPYATYRLSPGDTVGPASYFFQNPGFFTFIALRYNGNYYYQFAPPDQRGFVGFSFLGADSLTHYGYIELQSDPFQSAGSPGGLRFFGGSYETTANTAIVIVPEPGSLAFLAFGAAALVGFGVARRKKAQQN
jgi:hypothetical protein